MKRDFTPQKKGIFMSDNFIELIDMNPAPEANGRTLFLNRKLITAFYRKSDKPDNSVVLMVDGKTYDVQESIAELYELLD